MVPDPVAEIKRDKGPTLQEGQRNVLRAVRAVADVAAAGKISSKVADEYSASGGDGARVGSSVASRRDLLAMRRREERRP